MRQVIAYPHGDGIAIVYPVEGTGIPLTEICRKDVPYQTPYKVLLESDLPQDYEFRDAWRVDFTNPDGYGIGPQRWFIEQAEAAIVSIQNEQPPSTAEDISAWKVKQQQRLAGAQALKQQMLDELARGL